MKLRHAMRALPSFAVPLLKNCDICILSGMRMELEEAIRLRRKDRGALPSVRELAAEFGASPKTVHEALRQLAREGIVHALPRKGFFWGVQETLAHADGETSEERFRARLLSDLGKGAYHPWKELPSRKALAQVYGVGTRCAGRVLAQLVERGILEERGRGRFLAAAPPRRDTATSVLVVVRCDERGEFLFDTEREADFLKSVRRELAEQGLGFLRIGYHEEGSRFLDRNGRDVQPSQLRGPLLGALVSTWLVKEPVRLLEKLSGIRLPISAWWEHPEGDFPRKAFPFGLAGFNLSFGESSGTAVGRHLAAAGQLEVAFLSPYHNNEWSPARLRGLRRHLEACGGRTVEFVDPGTSSSWELQARGGGAEGMRRLLEGTLRGFLEDPRLAELSTWVFVNDLAAVAMHGILRARGGFLPMLVGFDNTSDSERLGFDSFEFHTDGMVRQMLLHLANPKARLFASGRRIHEMIGRFVVRSVPG
jgi:DNA-binding transcriptional regulator YhcF (GntR family)